MQPVYLAETIRAAERPLLEASPGLLMQRAAAGLAAVLLRELRAVRGAVYGRRVLLAVGSGNNGGDALYAGVRLLGRGVRVRAWCTGSSLHEPAWAAFRAAGGGAVDAVGAVAELASADLVVDGVLGIGGRPGLRGPVALFARACADAGVPVIAVDLPSGLDADSCAADDSRRPGERRDLGDASGGHVVSTRSTNDEDSTGGGASHFTARLTVTFGGLKSCHVTEPAASACGTVQLVDIGLTLPEPDLTAWQVVDVAAAWPFPDATSDKYSRGVVGIDTGSERYPGAAVLGTLGAVHAGAGMVRFLGARRAEDLIRAQAPNVVMGDGRVQARVLGSGWGDRPDGATVVAAALEENRALVLDADALRFLPGGALGDQVLLTPHAGELARLLGIDRTDVTADPLHAVRRAAEQLGATVLLKGASQYVCGPDGAITLAVPGPAWTAQAGSGDVLAGICGALLAAGLSPRRAALAGASVQALAAAAQPGPHPPQDGARALGAVIAALRR
ncbi:MAG TPA: NAD(P)H-hydrate dehydratase [Micropruina sp.]|nr:NAD(P)H-hydrate dehydratase [Micropruina sp.]